MSSAGLPLSVGPELLGRIFPFYLVFDRELRLIQHGGSVPKVCVGMELGAAFSDLFALHRPKTTVSFDGFRRAASAAFFLDSLTTQIRLRGQIVHEPTADVLLFVGAPWFTDIKELQATSLELGDFTVHDSIIDFLYMVQAKSLALADATRFSETIVSQSKEIQSSNESLKELSTSLAATNIRLATALERAEEATRLKSEFLASVSHELRSPLNAIINIPDGLLEEFERRERFRCRKCDALFECDPDEILDPNAPCPECVQGLLRVEVDWGYAGEAEKTAEYLQVIKRSGMHLLAVINDILDISKLEAGKMVLHSEDLAVAPLVHNVFETLSSMARQRGITLKLPTIAANVKVFADPVKLSQILLNLLHNAMKFSNDGGRIELQFEVSDGHCLFCVRDEGIGIAQENQSVIFESFRQVDGSHTRRFGGSGLGLAITKQLVILHGGTIWVESELGKGSAFFRADTDEGIGVAARAHLAGTFSAFRTKRSVGQP